MAWTTSVVTQNGNSTVTWSLSGGNLISTHDCIVLKPTSGTSGLKITGKIVFREPTRYHVTVQVIGTGAMAYRFAAERMD